MGQPNATRSSESKQSPKKRKETKIVSENEVLDPAWVMIPTAAEC